MYHWSDMGQIPEVADPEQMDDVELDNTISIMEDNLLTLKSIQNKRDYHGNSYCLVAGRVYPDRCEQCQSSK